VAGTDRSSVNDRTFVLLVSLVLGLCLLVVVVLSRVGKPA